MACDTGLKGLPTEVKGVTKGDLNHITQPLPHRIEGKQEQVVYVEHLVTNK